MHCKSCSRAAHPTVCEREGNCFNSHELNAIPLVFVPAVSIHIPGPLRDREPGNSVSKRAVVPRRHSRQSYLKFMPRSTSDLHFNLGSAVNRGQRDRGGGKSVGKANARAPRANYKLRTNLIPPRLTVTAAIATSASVPRLRTFLRGFDH